MTLTYKQKFNKKYGFPKDEAHSISEISKLTQWGIARVYSAVMGGKAQAIDKDLLVKK